MSSALASTVWPPTPISADVKELLSRFFSLVDLNDPEAGKLMVKEIFTSNAILTASNGTFTGEDELSTCRATAWDIITFRHHAVEKVFTGDAEGKYLILVGKMQARTKDNPDAPSVTEFAVRAISVNGADGKPRLKLWQAFTGNSTIST